MEAFCVVHQRSFSFSFSFLLSVDRVAAVGVPLGEAPPRLCGLKHITRAVVVGREAGAGGGGKSAGGLCEGVPSCKWAKIEF